MKFLAHLLAVMIAPAIMTASRWARNFMRSP